MTGAVIGVLGHVDHGKTALVRALTGQETDRLPEEKARGISIALGFAHLAPAPGVEVDLIDMPGHERFVRTMIAGASGTDAVLLVVAASEGVMPQTEEHVDIAGLLGVRRAVVAVTKADLVPPARAAEVARAAAACLARAGLGVAASVVTSAATGQGVEALSAALGALAAEARPPAADGVAFLPIDRAFSIAGHGPVVTGTLQGAALAEGDRLELLPSRRAVRVRAVQVHGAKVAEARPGQRVALNLRDVAVGDLGRGMVLAAPGALRASDWMTLRLRAVEGAGPLRSGARLRALSGTAEFEARLRLLDRDVLEPGEEAFAQVRLDPPAFVPVRAGIVLRWPSPARTVAGGRVIEPAARRLKRRHAPVLARLGELASLPVPEMIAAELERGGPAGADFAGLLGLSGLPAPRLLDQLRGQKALVTAAGLVVGARHVEAARMAVGRHLAATPEGLARAAVLALLPGHAPALVDEVLKGLQSRGAVALREGRYRLARPEDDQLRARRAATLEARIAETLRQGGLAPSSLDPAQGPEMRHALDRLLVQGVVVRAVDRAKRREVLFHRAAIEEAKQRLGPLLARPPGLLVTEIGAALGISRKYSVPLLNYLDESRFTRRDGDRRILARGTENDAGRRRETGCDT